MRNKASKQHDDGARWGKSGGITRHAFLFKMMFVQVAGKAQKSGGADIHVVGMTSQRVSGGADMTSTSQRVGSLARSLRLKAQTEPHQI